MMFDSARLTKWVAKTSDFPPAWSDSARGIHVSLSHYDVVWCHVQNFGDAWKRILEWAPKPFHSSRGRWQRITGHQNLSCLVSLRFGSRRIAFRHTPQIMLANCTASPTQIPGVLMWSINPNMWNLQGDISSETIWRKQGQRKPRPMLKSIHCQLCNTEGLTFVQWRDAPRHWHVSYKQKRIWPCCTKAGGPRSREGSTKWCLMNWHVERPKRRQDAARMWLLLFLCDAYRALALYTQKEGKFVPTRATIMCAPDTFLAAKRSQVHHSRICGVGYCTVQSQHRTIDQHRVKPNETKSADGSSHHAAFLEQLSTTDVVSYVTIKPTNHHQSSNVPAAKWWWTLQNFAIAQKQHCAHAVHWRTNRWCWVKRPYSVIISETYLDLEFWFRMPCVHPRRAYAVQNTLLSVLTPNIDFLLCDIAHERHFFSHPFPTRRYHPHTLPPKTDVQPRMAVNVTCQPQPHEAFMRSGTHSLTFLFTLSIPCSRDLSPPGHSLAYSLARPI